VVVSLGEPATTGGTWGAVSVREVVNMSNKDVVQAVEIVQDNLEQLRKE
jgi:hypothetical protein